MTTPSRIRRSGLVLAVMTALALVMGASAAVAQDPVAQNGSLLITEGPVAIGETDALGVVVVTSGDATVAGSVENIIVFDGDLTVTGDVDDVAWSVTGSLTVAEGGRVGGDAIAAGTLDVASGTVEGTVRSVTITDWAAAATIIGLLWWIGIALATVVFGLLLLWLAPRGMARATTVARARPGPSLGIGLALLVGVPAVAILLAFTLVGLPLTVGLLLATAMAAFVGHVVSALVLGRMMLRSSSAPLHLLLGMVVIGAAGLLPFVGGVVTGLAAVFGVGALAITVWRSRTPETIVTLPETAVAPSPDRPTAPLT